MHYFHTAMEFVLKVHIKIMEFVLNLHSLLPLLQYPPKLSKAGRMMAVDGLWVKFEPRS